MYLNIEQIPMDLPLQETVTIRIGKFTCPSVRSRTKTKYNQSNFILCYFPEPELIKKNRHSTHQTPTHIQDRTFVSQELIIALIRKSGL